jgi:hypothetical protein
MAASGLAQKPDVAADVTSNAKTNVVNVVIKGKVVAFTDYTSSRSDTWRFVTDGKVLIADLFYSGSLTFTPYKIVECKTFSQATNEITSLSLKLTQEQIETIARLAKEQKDVKEPVK